MDMVRSSSRADVSGKQRPNPAPATTFTEQAASLGSAACFASSPSSTILTISPTISNCSPSSAGWITTRSISRPALALEHEPPHNVLVAEGQIAALQSANVIECGLADDGVAGDQFGQSRSPCAWTFSATGNTRARAYVRPTGGTVGSLDLRLPIAPTAEPGAITGGALSNHRLASVFPVQVADPHITILRALAVELAP